MISISKYLSACEKPGTLFKRVLLLLLQGIEIHAIRIKDSDYDRFRSGIRQAIDDLENDPPEEELLVLCGSVITQICEYNERATAFMRRLDQEHRSTAELLAQTIRSLASGSKETVENLDWIRSELEQASLVDDLKMVRLRLHQCAAKVVEEIDRERTQLAALLSGIGRPGATREPSEDAEAGFATDPVTGLPGREAGVLKLKQSTDSADSWMVPVVATRVRAINGRWGFAAGDQILRSVAERLRNGLSAKDHVYRWRGATMVAVLSRHGNIEEVRREIARIWNKPGEELISVGNKSVMVPLLTNWSVYPLHRSTDWERKLDTFVVSQGADVD